MSFLGAGKPERRLPERAQTCPLGKLSSRVMARLEQQEAYARKETPEFKEDIRQAWVTVSYAARGKQNPFAQASLTMYGILQDEVWPRIVAQRRAKLGRDYNLWYGSEDNLQPDPHNRRLGLFPWPATLPAKAHDTA